MAASEYSFFDVVIKWHLVIKQSGSVHDARIFSNSGLDESFRNDYIRSCSKILVEGGDPVPVWDTDDDDDDELFLRYG